MEDNYDIEFGPNKVIKCEDCHIKLLPDEICWCHTNKEED